MVVRVLEIRSLIKSFIGLRELFSLDSPRYNISIGIFPQRTVFIRTFSSRTLILVFLFYALLSLQSIFSNPLNFFLQNWGATVSVCRIHCAWIFRPKSPIQYTTIDQCLTDIINISKLILSFFRAFLVVWKLSCWNLLLMWVSWHKFIFLFRLILKCSINYSSVPII